MELQAYSIRDSKSEIYSPPFYKKTHGEAERDFQSLCMDQKTMPGQYPEDFDLYFIGQYDDVSGKLTGLATPQHVIKAVNVINRKSAMKNAFDTQG